MVDMAHFAGLVAAGLHPNPFDHGADVVTTTTHKTLGGPRAGVIMCREEHAKKIDSAVFPGQQGGPLEHVIAAKAVAFRIAACRAVRRAPATHRRGRPRPCRGAAEGGPRGQRAHRRDRRAPRPRRPARVQPVADAAARPRTGCRRSGSRSTATLSRSTRARRWRPPGCGSVRPPWPRGACSREDFSEVGEILAIALTPDYEARAAELAERVAAIVERYPLYEGIGAAAIGAT